MSQKLSTSQKQLARYRTSSENVYFFIIRDFLLLSEFEQEIYFKRMYAIYLSSVRGSSYEEFKLGLINRRGKFKACILFIEKQFNTDIGFGFDVVDEIFFKENDYSRENTYYCAWDLGVVLPHFIGGGLALALYKLGRVLFPSICQGCNVITFQRIANPLMYAMLSVVGCLVYPAPKENPYPELDEMLRKMMQHYDSEGGTPEKPFVIKRSFRLDSDDIENYRRMYPNASEEFKYCADQTGLQDDMLFICLNVECLVEGNTLNIPAQQFTDVGELQYEYRFYDPYLSSLFKL